MAGFMVCAFQIVIHKAVEGVENWGRSNQMSQTLFAAHVASSEARCVWRQHEHNAPGRRYLDPDCARKIGSMPTERE